MIKEIKQDILTVDKGIIVHQVNCRKVMGAGLARQIATKYPKVKREFLAKREWKLGDVQFIKVAPELVVCNLAGQYSFGREPKRYTNYDALRTGFEKVLNEALYTKHNIFLPFELGCGLGGGDWQQVLHLIHNTFNNNEVTAYICKHS
jgi:O-acetyl-ADP-ribose deacetylase (regulator of RNase III)